MYVIRELPLWSPLYLLDGQSFLRSDPFLCELSLTRGPQRAALALIGMTRLVADCLQQATVLALDPFTAGHIQGEPAPPVGRSVCFVLALPDPSVPYDRAFRGLVEGQAWRSEKELLVVSDDDALCYEARGHTCVVIGVAEYRDRAMKALARLYGALDASYDSLAASEALVRALIDASRKWVEP